MTTAKALMLFNITSRKKGRVCLHYKTLGLVFYKGLL